MKFEDKITVKDKFGFHYEVKIKHTPAHGFSTAYYDDDIIAQREYGRMIPPHGDDDKEWEMWDERFGEWSDAAISDLEIECKAYFDRRN